MGELVKIWTDGACVVNPGPGGYAAIFQCGGQIRELAGGHRFTTNNRMEIMAAIVTLETLSHKCKVTIYSDSRYLVDTVMKGWAKRWQSNGWKRNRKEKALNADLWERLLKLCDRHEVEFEWVRGHASSPENARCDQMAEAAARKANLPVDNGFENEQTTIL
ncbi:MAG: ribonuclease HI [Bacteroidetes bacterium RBG_13_44_24]|nr:MAG: ribonuclease HI [Bacteroidetes bacterium RBG_13_44_24]